MRNEIKEVIDMLATECVAYQQDGGADRASSSNLGAKLRFDAELERLVEERQILFLDDSERKEAEIFGKSVIDKEIFPDMDLITDAEYAVAKKMSVGVAAKIPDEDLENASDDFIRDFVSEWTHKNLEFIVNTICKKVNANGIDYECKVIKDFIDDVCYFVKVEAEEIRSGYYVVVDFGNHKQIFEDKTKEEAEEEAEWQTRAGEGGHYSATVFNHRSEVIISYYHHK